MATNNNGFFDLSADERAHMAEEAMANAEVNNFFDLDDETRAAIYDSIDE